MAKTIGSFDLASLKNLRDDVTQYFWFESNSSSAWGSGAHVTLYPESQFTNPSHANYMKGQNIIMNTDGFSIRNGGLPMMVLGSDSLDFNAVNTSLGTCVTMATFGLTGATIGQNGNAHSVIDADGQRFYASDGTTQLANIGYGPGTNSSGGTNDAPYYTLGIRANENDDFIHDYVGTYSTSKTYNVGDLVLYNSSVYICKIKIDTPEPWTSSHWRIPIGNYSNSEGEFTISAGYASHAEGGDNTTALGLYSHAEGENTKALGDCSHTEGMNCIAEGQFSHAEGEDTRTIGDCSHAEGMNCIAKGGCSHAGNYETIASGFAQTTLGLYNIEDNTPITNLSNPYVNRQYALIIGNGTADNARSNALTVDWDGNVVASGSIISDTDYDNAWNHSDKGYTVRVSSLAGSTYLGQEIRLEKVSSTNKHPIFNGFDISGTGTARIHTLGHYIHKATYNGEQYWYAYIKMRNDNTSAINNFDVTAYIAWI